jgi:tyrosyl-tRNA synthetase
MTRPLPSFLAELRWRNLLAQCTDEPGLTAHLSSGTPRRAYIGFDPTSDSLTVGNLVPITLLIRFQQAGHVPVVVMGGGTGLIGDPSGKTSERQLNPTETITANVESHRKIFNRIWENVADILGREYTPPQTHNNLEWLNQLSFLEALRDIGKSFSINTMIQRDSIRERLYNRDQGISYTEFSYMLLQAYDFAHLHENHNITLQMGATDQWGNIIAGLDLIKKNPTHGQPAFGLTTPLITKSDGTKFGKTESDAIWLSPDRTNPYAFYQFWLNAADADIPRFIRTYALWPQEETEATIAAHEKDPGTREAHRKLAKHMTHLLHGEVEAQNAENAAKALFSGELAALSESTLIEVMANVPHSEHQRSTLVAGVPLLDLLITTKLATSKREAREFLENGSVSVNGRKVGLDDKATMNDLLHNRFMAIRRGKKNWHLAKWL